MILFACDKEEQEEQLNYLDHILAGQTSGIGIKYIDIEPDDILIFDYPASSTNRLIDINGDSIDDFELRFSGSASPGHRI